MASRHRHPSSTVFSLFFLLSLFTIHLFLSPTLADSHFEGFDAEEDDDETLNDTYSNLKSPPLTKSQSQPQSLTPHPPKQERAIPSADLPKPNPRTFDYWDEEEFEGLPINEPQSESVHVTDNVSEDPIPSPDPKAAQDKTAVKRSYTVEVVCLSFLIMFGINYFTGKKENENIALAWATKFATKDSIFEKNFSLLGVGEGEDSPLLLKEGQNVFKFYASGRRYCQGLLATMELKSRHDLMSRIYNFIVPCKDEISFEVYMNDDAMDHVVFALAKKKAAKGMQKELTDLQRFAGISSPPAGRKWVSEEVAVISESKEVAGDMITEAVLDQVFGEKAYEKFGKGFISMHFSDQHLGTHRKMLLFKFALPDIKHMADLTRLVALIPYYIDLVGRYKLSSQARSKTEAARLKVAQEAQKELMNARQEALHKRKAERKKMLEEAEAKLSAEALRKKEAKERSRQMKKAMPKIKMTRAQ